MKKEKKDKNFIHKPSFPGGTKAFKAFVRNNLKYPKEALENRIEGVVRVKYEINHLGEVIQTRVISGLGYGCDEEAQRIIKLLKFEVNKHRGVKVLFHRTTNIHFRLPKQKAAAISYSYNQSETKTSGKESQSYTYSIEW